MKVAFYLDNEDADLRECARLAVASVMEHMPGAEILHLTSKATRPLAGADTFLVNLCEGNFAVTRSSCHALVPGPCLFLDVDCILRRSVAELFAWSPDDTIALPRVSDPYVSYSGGVAYTAGPTFWRAWVAEAADEVYPDVRTHLQHFTRFVAGWPDVTELDEFRYERLASKAEEVHGYPGASIVHYRGPRKRFLLKR